MTALPTHTRLTLVWARLRQRITVHLELGRVSNLPTVWINTLTGLALADAPAHIVTVIATIFAFSALYTAGMYLNDYCDRDHDRIHQPFRPIARGAVEPGLVLAWVVGLMLIGFAALLVGRLVQASALSVAAHGGIDALGGHWSVATICLIAAIVTYDRHHKHNPLAPLLMAACRALVVIAAALVAADTLSPAVGFAAAATAIHVHGITAFARASSSIGNRLGVLGLAIGPAIGFATVASEPLVALPSLAAVVTLVAARRARRGAAAARDRAVAILIAGICWVDATVLLAAGEPYWALVVAAGYPVTRLWQRRIRGS